tara:strand:+ start:1206 stop:4286 length:3081 start_codon:yes stop_codon:yes gene_type:complete
MMSFTDDFNRADSATVGNGWTDTAGHGSILSNKMRVTGAGGFANSFIYAPASADFQDGTVSIKFQTDGFGSVPQLHCRLDAASKNSYMAFTTGGRDFKLAVLSGGSLTTLDEVINPGLNTNTEYSITLTAEGSTISSELIRVSDSVVLASLSAVDSTFSNSGKVGVSNNSNDVILYDDFNSEPAAVSSGYTVNSQPSNLAVLPRSSETGGVYSKGEALVPFDISITGATLLEYRLVDEDESTVIGGGTWLSAGGGGSFNVTTPANSQWYKLQVRLDGGAEETLANKFSVGGVTMINGQSLALRMFAKLGDSTSLSALGITPPTFGSTLVTYTASGQSIDTLAWRSVGDGQPVDSAFAADFLNRKIAQEGVSWAIVGHARGSQQITSFLSTGSEWSKMLNVMNATDWHEWLWFQGHSDAQANVSTSGYRSNLNQLYSEISAHNALTFDVYTTSTPNTGDTAFGNLEQQARIALAHLQFCQDNNFTYVQPCDVDMQADGIHQTQLGCLDLSRHYIRAAYSTDIGATVSGVSRSANVVTVSYDLPSGATSLVENGSAFKFFDISKSTSPYALLEKDSVVVNSDNVVITLSSDPLTDDLVLWVGRDTELFGSDYVTDDNTEDGFSVGRTVDTSVDVFNSQIIYNSGGVVPPPPQDTTAPIVTNNGPATVTITVGDTYTPDFSTNEGTLSIDNPVDTNTPNTYTVTATAIDDAGNVGSATQTVIVESEQQANQPPTAHAGPDQSVAAGVTVQLGGTGSTDSDGSIVSYSWNQTTGSTVTLTGGNTATPSFIAPSTDTAQTITFELTVTDDGGLAATDSVSVQVAADVVTLPPGIPPVADPGLNKVVAANDKVTLDGSGSTPGSVPIVSYSWSQLTGTPVIIEDASTSVASIVVPDIQEAETMVFELVVTDSAGLTGSKLVKLQVAAQRPFFINATRDYSTVSGDGAWRGKIRQGEVDSFTLTIDPAWITPENIVSYTIVNPDEVDIIYHSRQENIIQVYLTSETVGKHVIRFDYETPSRSDRVFVTLTVST